MDTNLKDFLLTGWVDMGNGFALAIHPEHRTMYGGSMWTLIDTVKGRPDVHFGPESLFGKAPISGRIIALVWQIGLNNPFERQPWAGSYCCYGRVDFLPKAYDDCDDGEQQPPNPAVSDKDFTQFLEKIRAILPKRSHKARIGSPEDRERAIRKQLMVFEDYANPSFIYQSNGHASVSRPSTLGKKVDDFFERMLDPTSVDAPLLDAVIKCGSDRKRIFQHVLGLLEDRYEYDPLLRLTVERQLANELEAMEKPYGYVYLSPDSIDIGGSGEEQHIAYWNLKFGDKHHGWRLMIATKRLILASDRYERHCHLGQVPEPAHKVVNGLVDLAGMKPTRGPKRKFSAGPKLEWGCNRIEAWQAVRIDGKSLRAVAKEYGVGVATLHRAITTLDPHADLLQPGALPMPGSKEDDALGSRLMLAQKCAHNLRKAGFTANHFHAYPLLSNLIVGDVDKLDPVAVDREIIKAWQNGVVPINVAIDAAMCNNEAQLRNLAWNMGIHVEEATAQ